MNFEYYVYGDFKSMVMAFKGVAAAFSMSFFSQLLYISIVTSVFFGVIYAVSDMATGGRTDINYILKKTLMAFVLVTALTGSTATVHVYDPVRNKYEAVGGVPIGLAAFAGISNTMARSVVDVIETVFNPIMSINEIGFGDGFEMLTASAAIGNAASSADPLLSETIDKYMYNCLDQAIASRDITIGDLESNSDLVDAIKLDYRVFYTDVFTDVNPKGSLMECADAWANINTRVKSTLFSDKVMKDFCDRVGYESTDASEFNVCKTKFSGLVQNFATNGSFDLNTFVASSFIARRYLQPGLDGGVYMAVRQADKLAQAANWTSTGMSKYIPQIQSMLATIFITMFIVVILFMFVSPLPAIKLYMGLWAWLMLWIIVDTMMNSYVQSHAVEQFRIIKECGMGLATQFDLGMSSIKMLEQYGDARWVGIGISSLFGTALFGIQGSSVFSNFTNRMAHNYQASASTAANDMATPMDRANHYNDMYSASTTGMTQARLSSVSTTAPDSYRAAMEKTAEVQHSKNMMKAFGGDWNTAGGAVADAKSVSSLKEIGYSQSMLKAASEAGVGIKNLEGAKGFKDTMEKAGLWEEFRNGRVNGETVKQAAKFNLLSEKGQSDAAMVMSQVTGRSYDDVVKDMKTGSGMQEYFRFQNAKTAANSIGMDVSELYQAGSNKFALSLNEEQAKIAGFKSGAGDYQVSFDKDSNVVFQHVDYGKSAVGKYNELMLDDKKTGKTWALKGASVSEEGNGLKVSGIDKNGNKVELFGYGNVEANSDGRGNGFMNVVSRTEDSNRDRLNVFADGKKHSITGAKLHNENGTWSITGQEKGKSKSFIGTGHFDDKGGFVFDKTSQNKSDVDKSSLVNVADIYTGGKKVNTVNQTQTGNDVTVLDKYTYDSSKNIVDGVKQDFRDTYYTGHDNVNYNVDQDKTRKGSDYDSGNNYKNVFQGGLDKQESENLAQAAWAAAYNKDSSWITSPATGKRHINWKTFEKNLASEIRQQTDDMNKTIGGFIRHSKGTDSQTFGSIVGGVQGSISTGTPGAVKTVTGVGAEVKGYAKSELGYKYENKNSYSADQVYSGIYKDHLRSIDMSKRANGSIDENAFINKYAEKLHETAVNYNAASKKNK